MKVIRPRILYSHRCPQATPHLNQRTTLLTPVAPVQSSVPVTKPNLCIVTVSHFCSAVVNCETTGDTIVQWSLRLQVLLLFINILVFMLSCSPLFTIALNTWISFFLSILTKDLCIVVILDPRLVQIFCDCKFNLWMCLSINFMPIKLSKSQVDYQSLELKKLCA